MIPLAHRAERGASRRVRVEGERVVAARARLRDGDADAIERVFEIGGDNAGELFGRRHGDEARDPLPVVAENFRNGGRAGGEFLHHDALGEDAGPVAAVRLGHAQGVEAERGASLHQVVSELVLPVGSLLEFGHLRQHLLHREFSGEELQAFLFFTQFEIHAVSLSVDFSGGWLDERIPFLLNMMPRCPYPDGVVEKSPRWGRRFCPLSGDKCNPPYPPLSGGQEKTKAPISAAGVAFSYLLLRGRSFFTPLLRGVGGGWFSSQGRASEA